MLSSWSLKAKLLTLGIALSVIPLLLLAGFVFKQGIQMTKDAGEECLKLAYADLDHIAEGIYAMVSTQHQLLLQKVKSDLGTARSVGKLLGKPKIDSDNKIEWTAKNQYTESTRSIELPKLCLGETWLGKNESFDKKTPLVDDAADITKGIVTVFQRMNEQGDMLRVATNVKLKDGSRAIGTFVPRTNPDGKENPVVGAIMRGETYTGRAKVVGQWHICSYEPIKDEKGRIIGINSVAIKQESVAGVREAVMATKVGKTGYVYVLDSAGHYLISAGGKRDGENISKAKDANGVLFIQEICEKAKKLDAKGIAEQQYPWKNKGDKEARMKVVRIKYFKDWDWVIGVGSYLEDFEGAKHRVAEIGDKSNMMVGGITLITLVFATVAWGYLSRSLSQGIGKVVERLTSAANEVASASSQVASSSQQMASGASEQASSLEEISASLEEMTSMTKQNADNANQANSRAQDASSAAQQGIDAMDKMSSAIDRIKQSSDETAKIVKTIDEIAFQTNLLALNAAVEAARAGEAGKGFAVVAEEVRNLAQRSAEAAKSTSSLLLDAQKHAEDGVVVSRDVASILDRISDSVGDVSNVINEVSTASNEQAQGIEQVNVAVAQLDAITQSNAANAEESASASEELSAQSQELNGMVDILGGVINGSNGGRGSRQMSTILQSSRPPAPRPQAARPLPAMAHEPMHTPKMKAFSHQPKEQPRPKAKAVMAEEAFQIIPLSDDELADF